MTKTSSSKVLSLSSTASTAQILPMTTLMQTTSTGSLAVPITEPKLTTTSVTTSSSRAPTKIETTTTQTIKTTQTTTTQTSTVLTTTTTTVSTAISTTTQTSTVLTTTTTTFTTSISTTTRRFQFLTKLTSAKINIEKESMENLKKTTSSRKTTKKAQIFDADKNFVESIKFVIV